MHKDDPAQWEQYPHFKEEEFNCSETGENDMTGTFMRRLEQCRYIFDKPMVINSGYRSPKHSIEAAKDKPGEHSQGMAADVACDSSRDRYDLVRAAIHAGFHRLGIADTYVHLGLSYRKDKDVIWLYP